MIIYSLCREKIKKDKISCVFVDEAQFLTDKQVWELSDEEILKSLLCVLV